MCDCDGDADADANAECDADARDRHYLIGTMFSTSRQSIFESSLLVCADQRRVGRAAARARVRHSAVRANGSAAPMGTRTALL